MNILQSQERFDGFRQEFNCERPHEALAMNCKAECYTPSKCRLRPAGPRIPFHGRECLVTACGRLCLHRKKINISTVLAGQRLKIEEADDGSSAL